MILVALTVALIYAFSIRSSIKVAAPKAGCSSCPHSNENTKTKID
jgi:hypothetical protein